MTVLTFSLELTDTWVEIANSDVHDLAMIYYESGSVFICVSDTMPKPDEENYVIMDSGVFTLGIQLPKLYKVYARSREGYRSFIRGYRKPAPGSGATIEPQPIGEIL